MCIRDRMRDIPLYPSTIETRYDCPDDVKFGVVERVKEAALAEKLNTITVDGVRIIYKDGWGLVRVSNTQPVLVARCEEMCIRDRLSTHLACGLSSFSAARL